MASLARLSARMASSSRPTASSSAVAASRLSTISRHLSSTAAMSASAEGSKSATPAPTGDSVLYESHGSARIYRLNRPQKLNSLNQEMITSLADKVKTWRESELCKVVIGTGEGRAFCAGGDVAQLIVDLKDGKTTSLDFFKSEFELNWALGRLRKPYVAVIDGVIMGGGAGISLPAPIRIATPQTIFAMPETNIGYAPDVGANYYLAQLDGWIGAWLAVTGQNLYGRAVYELGIATHYLPVTAAKDVVPQIAQLPEPTLGNVARLIAAYQAPAPESSAAASSKASPDGPSPVTGEVRRFLDSTFSLQEVSEIYAALQTAIDSAESSEAVKSWAQEQKKIMDMRSPTGMAVALEGYRQARKSKRLDKTLQNDLSMATAFSGPKRPTDDFITGVSLALFEKDKEKKKQRAAWSPNTIAEVTRKSVRNSFFDPSTEFHKSMPTLELDPPSSGTRGSHDSTWGQFRRYGLPSETEVEERVKGSSPGSGAFKITESELLDRMMEVPNGRGEPRVREFEEKIRAVVVRCCEKDAEGYLNWKL